MKYPPKQYAKAFVESGGTEKLIPALMQALSDNGDRARSAQVVREIEKLLVRSVGGRMVDVEFARTQDAVSHRKIMDTFHARDRVTTSVRPDLVAGVRVLVDGEHELDMSLSGTLEKLFV
jgi:F0F1-type ATP synthase delta subunit